MTDGNNERVPFRNPDGAPDPTPYEALTNIQAEELNPDIRALRMFKTIKIMLDLAGYDLMERIRIKDRKTGVIYK